VKQEATAASASDGSPPNPGRLAPAAQSADETQRRAAAAIRHSVAFAQMVSLLMRSPHYRHYALADLEWLVLPPLISGQFSIAEARANSDGPAVPVAMALWASVSVEVDQKLSQMLEAPVRLRPDEWRSGDTLWLIDAVGDARVIPQLLKQLGQTAFKGREVKVRRRGPDGKMAVALLREG
jgi:hemolysin-activating ACP:hemolysin acyltransferase